jgi:hypothetical protein
MGARGVYMCMLRVRAGIRIGAMFEILLNHNWGLTYILGEGAVYTLPTLPAFSVLLASQSNSPNGVSLIFVLVFFSFSFSFVSVLCNLPIYLRFPPP